MLLEERKNTEAPPENGRIVRREGGTLQFTRGEVDGDGATGGLLFALRGVAAEADEERSAQDRHCDDKTTEGRSRKRKSQSHRGTKTERKKSGKETEKGTYDGRTRGR